MHNARVYSTPPSFERVQTYWHEFVDPFFHSFVDGRRQTALESVGTIKKVALTAIFPDATDGTSTFQRSKPLAPQPSSGRLMDTTLECQGNLYKEQISLPWPRSLKKMVWVCPPIGETKMAKSASWRKPPCSIT